MARTNQQVTNEEIKAYVEWAAAHGIKNVDGTQDALDNAQVVANYMLETWKSDFTRETLNQALPMIRHLLKFHGPAEAEYHRHIAKLGPEQAQVISDLIGKRGLRNDGDNLYVNFNSIAAWLEEKRFAINPHNVDLALTNLISGKRPLIWHKRLQDSEKEALKNREQQPTQARKQDEIVIPKNLPGHLVEHYRMLHSPKPDETVKTQKSLDAEYQQRAIDAANSIQSNLDREEAQNILSQNSKYGWEFCYHKILRFIEQRKHDRQNVVR